MEATAMRHIDAPPEAVAKTMFDPRRDPEWTGGAKSVDPPRGDPTKMGSRTTRHGGFMGKKFSWQTEVEAFEPNRVVQMRFIGGPMKGGSVTYLIEPDEEGSLVSIRNTGPGPQILSWFVKRSVEKDIDRLARLVERG